MTEPAVSSGSFRALLPLARYGLKYRGRALAALVALTVSSAATLAVPFALREMIDFGFSSDRKNVIDLYFLAVAGLVIVIALAAAARLYLVTTLGERVVADLRRDVFAHLIGLDAAFYDGARTGELVSRLTADTTQIKAAFGTTVSIALRNLFMLVGSVVLMVYTSPKLSALVVVAIPVIAAPLIFSGRIVRRRSRHAQDTLAGAGLRRGAAADFALRRRGRRRLRGGPGRGRRPGRACRRRGVALLLQHRLCPVARRA